MFVRFVISIRDNSSGRRQGLFQAAYKLRASGQMSATDEQQLDQILHWFDENLAEPERLAFSSKPRRKAQAISWFRDGAKEHIGRMSEFRTLLDSYGIIVNMLRERRPGYVVYEDEHQVVAYPFSETHC